LISESLDKLYVSKIESPDSSQTRTKIALAKLLIQELGNLRSIDDAQLVANIYRDVKDPFLKAEAAVALGKMRATDSVEQLARDLADLNLKPDQANPRPKEILAYGLVQAMELMHSPVGFEPVFFASLGWYSGTSQVKEIARNALKGIVDDPSPQLKNIIIKDTLYDHKMLALESANESKAPQEAKAEIARIGLEQGLNAHETDVQKNAQLSAIRIAAIKMLVTNQDKSPDSVSLLQRVLDLKYNADEILVGYVALGRNGSDPAVKLLVALMNGYNERQKSGKNTADDRRFIMQVIQSLKETGSPNAKPVLVEAQFYNHDGTVARSAADAAASLP
jgi:HEAT repeat protein